MKKIDCFNCHGTCGCHDPKTKSMVACTCPFNGVLKYTENNEKKEINGYVCLECNKWSDKPFECIHTKIVKLENEMKELRLKWKKFKEKHD